MAKIIKVEQTVPTIKTKKKVAAYARVSMESERMNHSLSAQISYYSTLIQKNPDWQYAGVFADDGISGTSIEKRDEFKRMIAAAEKGDIDIILTKSIQRFARNTVDLLETVRRLKDIGVEVRFEKEHINSMDGDGELMLTILASFAQEESRSISENVKWGTRKRFEQGIPNGKFQIYGYRWDGDQLVVEPEKAKIVKLICGNGGQILQGATFRQHLHPADTRQHYLYGKPAFSERICRRPYQQEKQNQPRRASAILGRKYTRSHHPNGSISGCAGRKSPPPRTRCACKLEHQHFLLYEQNQVRVLRKKLSAFKPQRSQRPECQLHHLDLRDTQEKRKCALPEQGYSGDNAQTGLCNRPLSG